MGAFLLIFSMPGFGYGSKEKLKSRKAIDAVFAAKNRVSVPPVLAWYLFAEGGGPALTAGVTCSKRNFKKAVHRNRVKRLLREAYRLQKAPLQESLARRNRSMQVFFLYTGTELPDYNVVFEAMGSCLEVLHKKSS